MKKLVFFGMMLMVFSLSFGQVFTKITNPDIDKVSIYGITGNGNQVVLGGGYVDSKVFTLNTTNLVMTVEKVSVTGFSDVALLNNGHIWAVGADGRIFRKSAGVWSDFTVQLVPYLELRAVKFFSLNDGWTAGDKNTVYHWNGTIWSSMSNSTRAIAEDFDYSVIFGHSNDVYFAGADTASPYTARLYYCNGTGWDQKMTLPSKPTSVCQSPDDTNLFYLSFAGSTSTAKGIYTYNTSTNQLKPVLTGTAFNCVWVFSGGKIFAGGFNCSVFYSGKTWKSLGWSGTIKKVWSNNDCANIIAIINGNNIYKIDASSMVDAINDETAIQFSVYPNPTKGLSSISFSAQVQAIAKIELIDPLGRILTSESVVVIPGDNRLAIDLSNLKSGMYFLKLTIGTNSVSKLVLKE